MCIAFCFVLAYCHPLSLRLCLSLIPILCPMLLENELILFQFHILATLSICLSVLYFYPLLFSDLPPPTSILWWIFYKLSSLFFMAVVKGLLAEGNGDEERHTGWFPSTTYLQVMGLRKSDPREFIMRVTNPSLCELQRFFLWSVGGGRGVSLTINLLKWSCVHVGPS